MNLRIRRLRPKVYHWTSTAQGSKGLKSARPAKNLSLTRPLRLQPNETSYVSPSHFPVIALDIFANMTCPVSIGSKESCLMPRPPFH
ncbi:hypothetical protein RRG08_035383 [Elysia crispata]|uniref:Uncharacterized protein n=1 Tax=Elysia crispata TaxID=231223 RepID=A0AAE0Y3N2_9GAST|nr:hypothetical protein RRG08_035383 [Elysia crispata]